MIRKGFHMCHPRRHHNRSAPTRLSVRVSRRLSRSAGVAVLLSAAVATALAQDAPSATPPSSSPPDAANRAGQPDPAARARSSSSTPPGSTPRPSRAPRIPSPREELLRTLYGTDFGSYATLPLTGASIFEEPLAAAQNPFSAAASPDPLDRRWDPPSALRSASSPASFGTMFPDARGSRVPGGFGPRSAILHETNAAGFSASLKAKLDAILARPTLPGSSRPGFGLEDPLLRFGARSALFTGYGADDFHLPGRRQPHLPAGLSIAPPPRSTDLMAPVMSIPLLTPQAPGFSPFQLDPLNSSSLIKLERASVGAGDLSVVPPDASRQPTPGSGTPGRN
ncbi:MAG: hypothetical protein FLDDKLPJ_02525 [Phycisphaerae bacterium]|nr:hypothetical protein [Phycisphaerae bacterium]